MNDLDVIEQADETSKIFIEDWCDLYEGEDEQDNSHYC